MKKYIVDLDGRERNELEQLTTKGRGGARKIRRARILLLADEGRIDKEIASFLGSAVTTVELGTPGQPELALGTIAPGGVLVLNEDVFGWLDISEEEAEQIASQEAREMERRVRLFRDDRPEPVLKGETAILVDDGIATGMIVRAAIEYLRQQEPEHLVLAVPMCAAETAEVLRSEVDDLVCLRTPLELWAIGYWYEDFEQVSDEEVVELLERSRGGEAGERRAHNH